ncbi:DAK2 domain-containing protein [Kribbella sp. NPDC049584]|uniref:DAK2 domain-containing protein n=1 Tax=Kribbella sp. NPDC049584 TaxID=3154833 RepID=UPI003446DD00
MAGPAPNPAGDAGPGLRVVDLGSDAAGASALLGGGGLSAAKAVSGATEVDGQTLLQLGDALAERINERGKAELGDKTILDAPLPSLEVLRKSPNASDVLDRMLETASERVDASAELRSGRGGAAWLGERSIGHRDPGAIAYLRFLQALQAR